MADDTSPGSIPPSGQGLIGAITTDLITDLPPTVNSNVTNIQQEKENDKQVIDGHLKENGIELETIKVTSESTSGSSTAASTSPEHPNNNNNASPAKPQNGSITSPPSSTPAKNKKLSFLTILFRFTTQTDRILMAIGVVCAGGAGGKMNINILHLQWISILLLLFFFLKFIRRLFFSTLNF